jgi:UDP-glucose 4-epimerase
VILRFFNVYGPRQERSPYGAVISSFANRLRAGKKPVVFGDGLQTRDFVYISDVVEALMLALGRKTSALYNIGSGTECSILGLEQVLSRMIAGRMVAPQFRRVRPGDVRRSVADIGLAKAELRYKPRVGLNLGLRKTLRG